jgi:hypothetical protein
MAGQRDADWINCTGSTRLGRPKTLGELRAKESRPNARRLSAPSRLALLRFRLDSVNHDGKVGVEASGEDIVEQDRQQLPELRALAIALQFERANRTPRKSGGVRTVFQREIGSQLTEIARSHARDQSRLW